MPATVVISGVSDLQVGQNPRFPIDFGAHWPNKVKPWLYWSSLQQYC